VLTNIGAFCQDAGSGGREKRGLRRKRKGSTAHSEIYREWVLSEKERTGMGVLRGGVSHFLERAWVDGGDLKQNEARAGEGVTYSDRIKREKLMWGEARKHGEEEVR